MKYSLKFWIYIWSYLSKRKMLVFLSDYRYFLKISIKLCWKISYIWFKHKLNSKTNVYKKLANFFNIQFWIFKFKEKWIMKIFDFLVNDFLSRISALVQFSSVKVAFINESIFHFYMLRIFCAIKYFFT